MEHDDFRGQERVEGHSPAPLSVSFALQMGVRGSMLGYGSDASFERLRRELAADLSWLRLKAPCERPCVDVDPWTGAAFAYLGRHGKHVVLGHAPGAMHHGGRAQPESPGHVLLLQREQRRSCYQGDWKVANAER